jgi:hypothetical protein
MSGWESGRRLVVSAATALWVTILLCAAGYVRRCPTGKYQEEGENSLLEAAQTLAFARASANGWGSPIHNGIAGCASVRL